MCHNISFSSFLSVTSFAVDAWRVPSCTKWKYLFIMATFHGTQIPPFAEISWEGMDFPVTHFTTSDSLVNVYVYIWPSAQGLCFAKKQITFLQCFFFSFFIFIIGCCRNHNNWYYSVFCFNKIYLQIFDCSLVIKTPFFNLKYIYMKIWSMQDEFKIFFAFSS